MVHICYDTPEYDLLKFNSDKNKKVICNSSLYLGLHHETNKLKPWDSLTSGAPARILEVKGTDLLSKRLAELQGCGKSLVSQSTLHLFWDLFGTFKENETEIYADQFAYTVSLWGMERAKSRGIRTHFFRHGDSNDLKRKIRTTLSNNRIPVVVSDSYCPTCGMIFQIEDYLEYISYLGGKVIIDDTQGIGILGYKGGGILRHKGLSDKGVILISSLAKAFGVPIACISSNNEEIARFDKMSSTRVHCSSPSAASVNAALHALDVNARYGDQLRSKLKYLITFFRRGLNEKCLNTVQKTLFPLQSFVFKEEKTALKVFLSLQESGIQAVMHKYHGTRNSISISFIIRADMNTDEIEYLITKLFESNLE